MSDEHDNRKDTDHHILIIEHIFPLKEEMIEMKKTVEYHGKQHDETKEVLREIKSTIKDGNESISENIAKTNV